MIKKNLIILMAAGALLLLGCNPDKDRYEKYEKPDWLTGKVYTQMLEIPELSTYASCVELTGYDTIIDISGSYTVFAPDNDAFAVWLQQNNYASIEDIPADELESLVLYHIVQNPWTKEQLQELDVWGWIDTLDVNRDEPRGYKRESILKHDNRKLGVVFHGRDVDDDEQIVQIVDTLDSPLYRVYFRDARKYVPIFFKDYFDIYDLKSDDYEFYFDRPIESPDDLYFGAGKITGDEVFAENGFVYVIDQVVEPMQNAYDLLEHGRDGNSYKSFLDLCNVFPEFNYNENETYNQEGAEEGLAVDSLFTMSYPDLVFDLLNEKTTAPRGSVGLPYNVTIRYHHGVAAPTDVALAQLESDYLVGAGNWGSIVNAPRHIKKIIANTHLSGNPIYRTDINMGYLNGESDLVTFDESDIIQKEYGSNATFIGLNKAIVPRAFRSITGPVYLQKGFSYSMYAIENAGLLSALKRENEDYMLFVESDADCRSDSSLLYTSRDEEFSLYQGIGQTALLHNVNVNELRTLILNHVATRRARGFARKEFVPNLAGNYLVVNNETGEVSGTSPTTERYLGEVLMPNYPVLISDNADNGETFQIENWFSFSTRNLFLTLDAICPEFTILLENAGLAKRNASELTFLSDNEFYTIFAPSDSALAQVQADTLELEDLQRFLRLHFVQGNHIFTDGSEAAGYYETTRVDESSTTYNKVFSSIYINPGMDLISLPDNTGGTYVDIPESDSTNIMTGINLGDPVNDVFPVVLVNAIVHKTDKAFIYTELDAK